jgi:hypothetical protein
MSDSQLINIRIVYVYSAFIHEHFLFFIFYFFIVYSNFPLQNGRKKKKGTISVEFNQLRTNGV